MVVAGAGGHALEVLDILIAQNRTNDSCFSMNLELTLFLHRNSL